MANKEPVLLCPFGSKQGDNWFRTAFTWNRDNIFKWLGDMSNGTNPDCPADRTGLDILQKLYQEIESLSLPSGENYLNPQPRSHLLRSLDPAWGDGTDPTQLRFILNTWLNRYCGGPMARDISMTYCNPYDLLGLFFSLLGPAPQAADKVNYFLPLTAVFAKWCSQIAGRPAKFPPPPDSGTGNWPFMYQCTWHDQQSTTPQKWFFLGASLSGDAWNTALTGNDWQLTVQKQRFNMLLRQQQVGMVQLGDFANNEPERRLPSGSQAMFGSCAETYSFANGMLSDNNQNLRLCGLALSKSFFAKAKAYDGYSDGNVWRNTVSPCHNCRRLLAKARADVTCFSKDFDKYKAPPKTGP